MESEAAICPGCGGSPGAADEPMEDPFLGQTLPGGHRILERIGTGGMGRVYRAEQSLLGRTVAVKVIHPHLSRDETIQARFFTEAKAASRLNHPNSVNIIDFGTWEGRPYMVMEFLRGQDLNTVREEQGPLSPSRVVSIMSQALAALGEAHHLGIVHRDLKPENIVLQPLRAGGDFVKVVDFGLAVLGQQAQWSRLTFPGMVCGSPHYMAPEHIRGDEVDGRADLYSCGIILYELLTDQVPFDGDNPHLVLAQQLNDAPADPRTVTPDRAIPEVLAEVVLRALAKPVTARFQSAQELSDALRQAVETLPLSQPASGYHLRCPDCRGLVRAGQRFCGQCGARLLRSSAPPRRAMRFSPSLPSIDAQRTGRASAAPIGRAAVLAWLAEQRHAVTDGPLLVAVTGPTGVGKTRVLAAFAERAEGAGDVVVRVGPDRWRARVGYHSLREAVCRLAELPADGGPRRSWPDASAEVRAGLEQIFDGGGRPSAGSWTSWSELPPMHLADGKARRLAAAALRWALRLGAERASSGLVTVLVDDWELVDGASRHALADAARAGTGAALLVAADEAGGDGGDEDPFAARWPLAGLSDAEAAALLEESPASLPRGAGATRGDAAPGHLPLFLEQVVRFHGEGGDDPPAGLSDLIALRVERLPAARRRILQTLAVLGDGVTAEQVTALTADLRSTQIEDPSRSFSVLVAAGLIYRQDRLVWISHPLIREVVLWGTPAEVRVRLHRQARTAQRPDGGDLPIEARAHHAVGSADVFEALHLVEQVALRAAERGDLEGCVQALQRGLALARADLSRGGLDDPVSAQLHFSVKLADALALRGELSTAEGVLSEALDLGGPRAAERPRLLASQAHVAFLRGRYELARARLAQAREVATELGRRGQVVVFDRLARHWAARVEGLGP